MNRTRVLIGLSLAAVVLLSMTACTNHTTGPTHSVPPPVTPPSGPVAVAPPTVEPTAPKKGVIYVVGATGGDDNDLIPKTVTWHSTNSPALDSLDALAETDHSPLPSGTQIRGVKIADGTATVDFSREFQTNFHGGDTQEAQTINSILRTLGQFPSIDHVQILVEGKPIDALSQLPIDAPLNVIRPDTVRQARDNG